MTQKPFTVHVLGKKVSEQDMAQILDLIFKSYSAPPHNLQVSREYSKTYFTNFIERNFKLGSQAILLVARDPKRRIIGVAAGARYDLEKDPDKLKHLLGGNGIYYQLQEASVDPAFRRQGVSTRLTKRRLEHARNIGCTQVFGETNVENIPRTKQFEKEGFHSIGLVERQVPGGIWTNHVFHKHL